MSELDGMKVAILVTDGFEEVELTRPREALEQAGARTSVVAPDGGTVKGWNRTDWGEDLEVDLELDSADPEDFDALVLPGGVMNPDHLRMDDRAVAFVRHFFATDKPVAAICHGPWTLIEADVVVGRRLTSYPSLRTDLENAGADWVDEEVVRDGQLVTSRNPDDLPAFVEQAIDVFAETRHERAPTR